MLATLDIRNRLRDRLRDLGISAATFAGLVGLSDGQMSDFMRGKRSFGNERENEMLQLLDEVIQYRDALLPFQLPLNDVGLMRRLIEHFRKNEITPGQVNEYITALVGSEQWFWFYFGW